VEVSATSRKRACGLDPSGWTPKAWAPASTNVRTATPGMSGSSAARTATSSAPGSAPAAPVLTARRPSPSTNCSPPDILHLVRNNVVSTQAGQLQLASSGLRVGEAIRLERVDVDLARGLITIRESKFLSDAPGTTAPRTRGRRGRRQPATGTGQEGHRDRSLRFQVASRPLRATTPAPGLRQLADMEALVVKGHHDIRARILVEGAGNS